jgi:hypothetical protein
MPLNYQTTVQQTEITVSYQVLFLHCEDAAAQVMFDLMSMLLMPKMA